MKKDGLNYFLVNVITRKNGYSFMVTSQYDNLTDEEIIDLCVKKDLFAEKEDYEFAEIDTLIDEYDINAFEEFTYSID
jgi:hypothetical protein